MHVLFISVTYLHAKNINFHVDKFSFLSSNWKVCPGGVGFSVTGQETEFPGDKNSWFSHGNSSPGSKENAIHFSNKCIVSIIKNYKNVMN